MYGNKANNLIILDKNGFKIPKFKTFSESEEIKYEDLNLRLPLILRSSYSIEDGKKNAFAGIFESYFPIYNQNDYKKGLEICKNADNLDKFKTYISINKINISKMKKNFIVQEFITGDFSGVCFTKNTKNQIVIEIVPGLNEPLVQGNVKTPFSIKINRNNIKEYDIHNFYMGLEYKTIENQKILNKKFDILDFEEKVLIHFKDKLIYQFLKIEKLLGYPQDIEFTVKGNDIYILQSRNITTL